MMRQWLVGLRKDKEYTQAQVAAEAFIDRSYYAQIESGKRDPSHAVAEKISEVLGFNPAVFYTNNMKEPFNTSLEDSPVIVAQCDLELRYTWLFNAHFNISSESMIGKRDNEIMDVPGMEELMDFKQHVIETGQAERKIIRFVTPEIAVSYDIFCKPLRDEEGSIMGAAVISTRLNVD